MGDNSDPSTHQRYEQQFIAHVQRLIADPRLRVDTTRGLRPASMFFRDVSSADRGVELKRLMAEVGKPDRNLESHMARGQSVDVVLSQKKWWVIKTPVGRVTALCISPNRQLLTDESSTPSTAADVAGRLAQIPKSNSTIPQTIVIMSTSGFTPEARDSAARDKNRTLILVAPNGAGGWTVTAPAQTKSTADLFDPEADTEKRARLHAAIEAGRVDLLSSGLAADTLAARAQLPPQFVEGELKSYARENPGLVAKRLDGRWILFRQGAAPAATPAANRGSVMPFIDRMKSLFSRKGEIEKKIEFLSERRTALSQQRDNGYEDMGAMENKESQLRQDFKAATGDITRRRITSQLVQLRKDIERRQQLLSVLNQQVNVVSTHLHNLELQRQGKTANLPDTDEMAADAAAAEEVLAELQAGSELADAVGSTVQGGMSSEEQALYDELMQDQSAPAPASPAGEPQKQSEKRAAQSPPPVPQRQRNQPEPG